jgi:hypothetical protein
MFLKLKNKDTKKLVDKKTVNIIKKIGLSKKILNFKKFFLMVFNSYYNLIYICYDQ